MRNYFLLTILLFTSYIFGQNGTVSGVILDKEYNNEPLPFANILIKDTKIGASTDDKGKYSLSVEPGNYILVVGYLGYKTVEIPFEIKSNENKVINYTLESSGVELKDVTVVKTVRKNTENAVLNEVKASRQIVNAISAEQMSKGVDANAAQAMQRIPGVTIIDGKFIVIRGLSERYNTVTINNSIAPSTEVDRRTFSFDLLPTSALEKMTVSKTASSFMPGDFSGGVIGITTSENFTDFTQASFNVGYRVNTTFGDYWQTKGSSTDFLGFDNGFRQLPSSFPAINSPSFFDPNQSVALANQLENNFNPEKETAVLDTGIGFSIGRNITLKNDKKLSTVNIFSYSNKYENYAKAVNTFINDFTGGNNVPQEQKSFNDNYNSNETKLTVLSNWFLRINDKNRITFKNLFNQIGENYTTLREGKDVDQRPGQVLRNYEFGYTGRRIFTSQLNGDHDFSDYKSLHWVFGGNIISDIMPDLRRFRTFREENQPNDPFTIIDPPSSNPFDTGRYFSDLKENSVNGGLDYTYKIDNPDENEFSEKIVLKTGFYTDLKNRDFEARYFSYIIPGSVSFARKEELIRLPLSEVFAPQNVSASNGWQLREGSRLDDSYKASNFLTAGYIYGEYPINKFLLTGGLRVEHNILQIDGNEGNKTITVQQPITSILPSLNVSYNGNEKNVIRFAYSRTVNRPEFREIAPFLFYNFQEDTEVIGSTDLTTATIDNLDFRYEFYPNNGEIVSAGLFFKNFDKPIEFALPAVSQQRRMQYTNSEGAILYGAEIELRKSFKEVFKIGFLSDLSVNLNASYIVSEVDLGKASSEIQQKRALQGQSPYVVNFALGYNNEDNGWSGNLIYNRFGDRIYAAGSSLWATIYELSRDQLDLSIAKTFGKVNYKLGIANLIDSPYRFFQDSNTDEKIKKSEDDSIFSHKIGALINFNVTYKF